MARYVAKNVVAAGLADRFEIQISYAIGIARPLSIMIETFGTEKVAPAKILELIKKHFDMRPAAIIHQLQLRRPIYRATAAYGHFGRNDIDAPWELTDKAAVLRAEAGLGALEATQGNGVGVPGWTAPHACSGSRTIRDGKTGSLECGSSRE